MSAGHPTSQELVEIGLAAAGPGWAAVLVDETATVNLRWALNGLTTNGMTRARSVTAIVAAPVVAGTAVGVLSRDGLDAGGVRALVTEAAAMAAAGSPAEDAAPQVEGGALPGWDDPAGELGSAAPERTVRDLGEVFARAVAEGTESFGYAVQSVSTTWLGTSSGLRIRHEQPAASVELNGKAAGRTRSAWAGRAGTRLAGIDVLAMDEEVHARLGWQRRQVEVPPGRYDTVLPSSAVGDLLTWMYWSSEGRAAAEGRSAFSRPTGGTRIGERLSDRRLRLRGDPGAAGLSCARHVVTPASGAFASVFDNGLPIDPVDWIEDGRLAALPTTRHSARLTGLPFRPAVDNLLLADAEGTGTLGDVVAGTERGLLLTCLWYIREVDLQTMLLTGLTRDGVYLIEGGEVVGGCGNFRFNESPVDMLGRVQAASAPEPALGREFGEYFPRVSMPALRISGFNMSTASEAS